MTPEELAGQHITPSIVRLSIGTEYIDDIIDDLDQALAKVGCKMALCFCFDASVSCFRRCREYIRQCRKQLTLASE